MNNKKKNVNKFFKSIDFKTKSSNIKNRFIETLNLPKELNGNCTKITMIENNQILIDGDNNIVDYSDDYIKIQSRNMYIIIDGRVLKIEDVSNTELLISGNINNIGFQNR